jgi:hypothetical protein
MVGSSRLALLKPTYDLCARGKVKEVKRKAKDNIIINE